AVDRPPASRPPLIRIIQEAVEPARVLSPGPPPVLASAALHLHAGFMPIVKPIREPLETGCSAPGAGPRAPRAATYPRFANDGLVPSIPVPGRVDSFARLRQDGARCAAPPSFSSSIWRSISRTR